MPSRQFELTHPIIIFYFIGFLVDYVATFSISLIIVKSKKKTKIDLAYIKFNTYTQDELELFNQKLSSLCLANREMDMHQFSSFPIYCLSVEDYRSMQLEITKIDFRSFFIYQKLILNISRIRTLDFKQLLINLYTEWEITFHLFDSGLLFIYLSELYETRISDKIIPGSNLNLA